MKAETFNKASDLLRQIDTINEMLEGIGESKIRDARGEFMNKLPQEMIDRQYEERAAWLKGRLVDLMAEFEAL